MSLRGGSTLLPTFRTSSALPLFLHQDWALKDISEGKKQILMERSPAFAVKKKALNLAKVTKVKAFAEETEDPAVTAAAKGAANTRGSASGVLGFLGRGSGGVRRASTGGSGSAAEVAKVEEEESSEEESPSEEEGEDV